MIIKCKRCGKNVETIYSGTKYCKVCSKEAEKERWRLRNEKRKEERKKKRESSLKGKSIKINSKKPKKTVRKYTYSKCWDCENCYGGCSWTQVDTKTNKIKHEPVNGWKAQKTKWGRNDFSYLVYECPLFIQAPEKVCEDKEGNYGKQNRKV